MTRPRAPLGVYPAMMLYVRDWLSSRAVNTMTLEQQAAYLRLLCHAWPTSPEQLGQPCTLPDNAEDLACLSGLGEKWEALGAKVRAQFECIEGEDGKPLLRNPKQHAVYLEAIAASEAKSAAGRAGMRARWDGQYPPEFEACWTAYPRRPGNSKRDAFKAWTARVNAGAAPADLLAGTERYAAFIRATGKEGSGFVKMAATFYGPGDHYAEAWEAPATPAAGKAFDLDRARARWTLYEREGLTRPQSRDSLAETLTRLVGALFWPSMEAAKAELAAVRPWDIARTARDTQAAIAEVARRLPPRAA